MTRKHFWRSDSQLRQRARQLRRGATLAEAILWQALRLRTTTGFKWRRQHPIGPFIADFYCAEHRLIVELDGPVHDSQVERDAKRTERLEREGYRVIRFRNEDVEDDVAAVIERIIGWIEEQG